MSKFDLKGAGEIARVNNIEAARKFFDDYDIPYHYISKGENAGKIRVKTIRNADQQDAGFFFDCLEILGLGEISKHAVLFRDVDDELVLCFDLEDFPKEEKRAVYQVPQVFGYEAEIRDESIFSTGTKMAVFRRA